MRVGARVCIKLDVGDAGEMPSGTLCGQWQRELHGLRGGDAPAV